MLTVFFAVFFMLAAGLSALALLDSGIRGRNAYRALRARRATGDFPAPTATIIQFAPQNAQALGFMTRSAPLRAAA